MSETTPKFPFNDYKHIPSRAEIDRILGPETAGLLKRFEEKLGMKTRAVSWEMHWSGDEQGWGYRGTYKNKVLCVLHFYRGFFSFTVSIPETKEAEYKALKELKEKHLNRFAHYKQSPHVKWITIHVHTRVDVEAIGALVYKKFDEIKEKKLAQSGGKVHTSKRKSE